LLARRGAAALVLAALLVSRESPPGEKDAAIRFEDVTKRAGLRFRFDTDLRRGRNVATMGGGVAMGDFDGDGWLDLFFTGSVSNGNHPEGGPCGVLYRNRGDGTFEDVTARSGVHSCGWTMGASWVDLDGTGRLDLVVTGLGRSTLWKSQGDGTFRDVSEERGFIAPKYAVGLAAGDVDGDGRVDLYVVNYLDTDYRRELAFPQFQLRLPEDYAGQDAFLFVQRPGGSFEERAAAAHVTNQGGRGLQAVFFDYDGDGLSDLYVSNDRVPNVLYKNLGHGTFEDTTVEAGAGMRDMRAARAGMGIAVGDLDGDGRPEILVTNFAGEPDTLYRNVEGVLFDDVTESSGIERGSVPPVQWGTEIVDLDDDGRPDVVAVSGHLVPRILRSFAKFFRKGGMGELAFGDRRYLQPPLVWRNVSEDGSLLLADVTEGSGDFAKLLLSARGLAAGDVDGDGRVDLAIAAISGGIRLLRNRTASVHHAIEILPVAGADRRTVLGTKVVVTAGGRRRMQEFILRPSYASGSWVPLHFGLREATVAEKIEIVMPGETAPRFTFENVSADRLYALRDGALRERRALAR
jgi:enediyne biosynthesis protein E4